MKTCIKRIVGNWADGYALDKHSNGSIFMGNNQYGHATFDIDRTEAGEAVFQLKYRGDFDQVHPLEKAIFKHILPNFEKIGLVIPAPASEVRTRQPVHEVATALAKRINAPLFENIITKSAVAPNSVSLKNMNTKDEKQEALRGRFLLNKAIISDGKWNVLIVDDLYHTGATMEAVCKILSGYDKIANIYIAALTWR